MYSISKQLHSERELHPQDFLKAERETSALRELAAVIFLALAHEIS
jgi:hypothetical protein